MTDQHRGDALGADPACPTDSRGDPFVHTPNIDSLVENGALFSRAYSPAPTCVPARRCLWTGQTPATNGCPNWVTDEWDFENTLPEAFRNAGYQTRLAGKTHSHPPRNHFGFEEMELHAGLGSPRSHEHGFFDDYDEWLRDRSDGEYDENSHGLDRNSWDPRPWHRPEHEHPTNWTTNRALEFIEKRDPTRPFFLTVSYVRPHQPFDPPQPYWDMYVNRDLPNPDVGDWADDVVGDLIPDYPHPDAWVADLPANVIHRARAGYYGSITHIDHQLNRIFTDLAHRGELENTIIMFTSDHGEMLGDHHHWRKSYAYEGSARVPLVVRIPNRFEHDFKLGQVIEKPVGLEDIMPTLLDFADIETPSAVEGRSLRPLLLGEDDDWREYYHGEHGPTYHDRDATQYLVGEDTKYIWNPVSGDELLFNLDSDPGELENLADDPEHDGTVEAWRNRLIDLLADRPEGFVRDRSLQTVDPDTTW